MKYTFVTGLHGNEPIPVLALASKGIPQLVAHPRALSQGQRYIDDDLNKSFGTKNDSYESQHADEILATIPETATVIDFHTFTAKSDPFAIVVDLDQLELAKQTGLSKIVYMEHSIKASHALIDHRNGISVEVGQHRSHKSFETTLAVHTSLNDPQNTTHPNCEVFRVTGVLEEDGEYENFIETATRFFPILAGKNSYDFYGLRAVKMDHQS